jgi:hypothetical protein
LLLNDPVIAAKVSPATGHSAVDLRQERGYQRFRGCIAGARPSVAAGAGTKVARNVIHVGLMALTSATALRDPTPLGRMAGGGSLAPKRA